jgi:hypothetical protein
MVRRSAFARDELLVAAAVVALLLGLLARTLYKVHETVARTGSQPAAQVRPGANGQPPREWAPPEVWPEQAPTMVHASWTSGQEKVARERRPQ